MGWWMTYLQMAYGRNKGYCVTFQAEMLNMCTCIHVFSAAYKLCVEPGLQLWFWSIWMSVTVVILNFHHGGSFLIHHYSLVCPPPSPIPVSIYSDLLLIFLFLFCASHIKLVIFPPMNPWSPTTFPYKVTALLSVCSSTDLWIIQFSFCLHVGSFLSNFFFVLF